MGACESGFVGCLLRWQIFDFSCRCSSLRHRFRLAFGGSHGIPLCAMRKVESIFSRLYLLLSKSVCISSYEDSMRVESAPAGCKIGYRCGTWRWCANPLKCEDKVIDDWQQLAHSFMSAAWSGGVLAAATHAQLSSSTCQREIFSFSAESFALIYSLSFTRHIRVSMAEFWIFQNIIMHIDLTTEHHELVLAMINFLIGRNCRTS